MARRTVASARRELEDLAPTLNDHMRRTYEGEINAAAGKAKAVATRMLEGITADVDGVRDEVLAEVCDLRDDFAALAAEGEMGTLSAAEYAERFNDLQDRQRTLRIKEQRLTDLVSHAERIESDPEATGDSLFQRFPHIQPDFSF